MFAFIFILSQLLGVSPETLVAACLSGKPADVERFVLHFNPLMRRAARRVLFGGRGLHGRMASQEDIDDAVQLTYMALFKDGFRQLSAFDPAQSSANTYLTRIATREAHNLCDKKWAKSRMEGMRESLEDTFGVLDSPLPSAESSPEETLASRQHLAQLEARLLERLSANGRLYYRLLIVEELETEDVVRICQVDRSVVYDWRKRIKAQWVSLLEEDGA